MTTQTNPTTEPVDAVRAAAAWSKVSAKKIKNRASLYWLLGGAVAILLVLWLSVPSKQSHVTAAPTVQTTDYHASLHANLARLKVLSQQQPQTQAVSHEPEMPFIKPQQSKALVARQHAPTTMYTSSSASSSINAPKANATAATFADGDGNAHFGNVDTRTTFVTAKRINHPDFAIASGEFLQAVLETAIDSDLPGMVRAVVSRPVYALTSERLLIPAGSRLMGQYRSAILQGQNRVMIIWNRVLLPNGIAVQINSPGTDALGRAGQGADHVNRHFLAHFGEAALLSVIGAGVATGGVDTNDRYNSAAQYRMAIAQSFQQSASQALQGSLPIKPTLHIDQGAKLNVFVAHDLSFYDVLKHVALLTRPSITRGT